MRYQLWMVSACWLALAACGRDIQNQEAVRQGVIDHLNSRKGLDLASMQLEVTKVSFRKDEADATVSFRPRGATDPNSAMTMKYTLEKKGSRWVVKGKSDMGNPHAGESGAPGGGMGAMPPGHPPAGAPPAGGGK